MSAIRDPFTPASNASLARRSSAANRPASQVMREMMRELVQRQREAREYDEFLRRKVETARTSMHAGRGRSNEEVEAKAAARRAKVAGRA